ncbi:MAG: Ger(x)C family spore germination protein [Solirubrobacterales bacterium]
MRRAGMVFIFAGLIFLAGCYGRHEINDLAMVVGFAIDSVTNQPGKPQVIEVTAQIANPVVLVPGQGGASAGTGGPKAFWTVSGKGRSIQEALGQMVPRIPKVLFFGQNRIVFFGEQAARHGLLPMLDRLQRSTQARENNYVVIVRGKAKTVLEVEMPVYRSSGIGISSVLELKGGQGPILPYRLYEFINDLESNTGYPIAPVVKLVPQTSVNVEDLKSGAPPAKVITFDGSAVFDRNCRLVGFYNNEETLGIMWVKGKMRIQEVVIPCPEHGMTEPTVLRLDRRITKIKAETGSNGSPRFRIMVEARGELREHFGPDSNLRQQSYINQLEREAAAAVEKEIRAALKKSQTQGIDVLGLGKELERQKHQAWIQIGSSWPAVYPTVEVSVKANITMAQRGTAVEAPGRVKEPL